MNGPTLIEIARAVPGGKVSGNQVLAPGPGHSHKDKSLSIRLSAGPDGFVVYSHAGDDFRDCRDYVADALGLSSDRWRAGSHAPDPEAMAARRRAQEEARQAEEAETAARQRRALAIWNASQSPAGTIVEAYLASRRLALPGEISGETIRFHRSCPWDTGTAPAMVTLFRDIITDEPRAIHRTALTHEGKKVGRKMLGPVGGCAIKLDADQTVTTALAIGEGIETCLAARQLGITPTWALGSTTGIAAFRVLDGIERLQVLGENDETGASDRACNDVGARWHRAGRSVEIITPKIGTDLNDVVMEGATTWE
ncbi:virulence-associated protein E [Methylobacterium sp. W2]|uniref:DUF7146 domain-containing protein n=1 Tax=Methylobacterium sp. W2 TaxID=2598107 RepID=UPI001D0C135E|nr:toprim domain-containing protein [Methylobacterium sp. W2]MCC0808060.1 virulence-associated protein E [Methylobacterium sp. W2]